MARQPIAAFGEGVELVRVYLAARVDEAERAERALAAAGVTFGVEVERLPIRNLFGLGAARTCVGLWIREEELDAAAGALEAAGLRAGLVERPGGPGTR